MLARALVCTTLPATSESERPAQLGRVVPGGKLTKSQAPSTGRGLACIVDVLAEADPEDKADLYAELGVSLRYYTDGRVAVEALPRGVQVRVGGGTCGLTPRARLFRSVVLAA
jgi:hypothetical protein